MGRDGLEGWAWECPHCGWSGFSIYHTTEACRDNLKAKCDRLRGLLAKVLDFYVLGHGITPEEHEEALVVSGRYCEPFRSVVVNVVAALKGGG